MLMYLKDILRGNKETYRNILIPKEYINNVY